MEAKTQRHSGEAMAGPLLEEQRIFLEREREDISNTIAKRINVSPGNVLLFHPQETGTLSQCPVVLTLIRPLEKPDTGAVC